MIEVEHKQVSTRIYTCTYVIPNISHLIDITFRTHLKPENLAL